VFRIIASKESVEDLKCMDKWLAAMLMAWMQKNLTNCVNPRNFGKPMFKKDDRFWQYRFGRFRLLALIYDDSKRIILAGINFNDTI